MRLDLQKTLRLKGPSDRRRSNFQPDQHPVLHHHPLSSKLHQAQSFCSSLLSKTLALFLFLLLNACFLPLVLDVFKIASYVSLTKLINPQIEAFFNMDSSTYYNDFSNILKRKVSPYFINFLVLNLVLVMLWGDCAGVSGGVY